MSEASFQAHLQELKERLKHSFIILTVLTAFSFYFSSDILQWIQEDLSVTLHALKAYEALFTQLLIAVLFGFFLSLPVILYQALKFVKPGLTDREYSLLRNYLPFSVLLFIGGAVFAYQFIVKSALNFFRSTVSGTGVQAVWGLQNTIGFALKLSAYTGVMFQLPIVSLILAKAGVINSGMMREYRAHFSVAVLLLSAVATPPDIISQVLLTVPVILLYHLSIFLVGRIE